MSNPSPESGSPIPGNGSRFAEEPASPQLSWKEVLDSMIERLGEIREYASYYVSTQTDSVKSKLTWIAIYAVLGMIGAVVGLAVLATVGVLLIVGLAGAL